MATYGTVDELNSQIGVALATGLCERLTGRAAADPEPAVRSRCGPRHAGREPGAPPVPTVEARHIEKLETAHRRVQRGRRAARQLPAAGRSPGAAQLHVARTICRRAEREATTLARDETIGATVLPYLNRLSDALFVMARYENHERGVAEPLWEPGR